MAKVSRPLAKCTNILLLSLPRYINFQAGIWRSTQFLGIVVSLSRGTFQIPTRLETVARPAVILRIHEYVGQRASEPRWLHSVFSSQISCCDFIAIYGYIVLPAPPAEMLGERGGEKESMSTPGFPSESSRMALWLFGRRHID